VPADLHEATQLEVREGIATWVKSEPVREAIGRCLPWFCCWQTCVMGALVISWRDNADTPNKLLQCKPAC